MRFGDAVKDLKQNIDSSLRGDDRIQRGPDIESSIPERSGLVKWVNDSGVVYFEDTETRKPYEIYVTEVEGFHGQSLADMHIDPGVTIKYRGKGRRAVITNIGEE